MENPTDTGRANLRDQFAMAALPMTLADQYAKADANNMVFEVEATTEDIHETAAVLAYGVADAMLKARNEI